MVKRIVLALTIAVVLTGGVWYFFTYHRTQTVPVSEAIKAIPPNASLIIESHQWQEFWKKIAHANVMWQDITDAGLLLSPDKNGRYIDSFLTSHPEINTALKNRSVFISAHVSGAEKYDFLYLFAMPDILFQENISRFLRESFSGGTIAPRLYDEINIEGIRRADGSIFYYAFSKGIFLSSFNSILVEDAIRQLKSSSSLLSDPSFVSMLNASGDNPDVSLYVNFKTLPSLAKHFVKSSARSMINAAVDFAGWMEVDVTVKPGELLLNGFTGTNDSLNSYISIFNRQEPQKIELTSVLPANTASFLFFGISNMKSFRFDYKNYLEARHRFFEYNQRIEQMNRRYQFNSEKSMLSWIGQEMAIVFTESSGGENTKNNCYAVFKAFDIRETGQLLHQLSDTIRKKHEPEKVDTLRYEGHLIDHLEIAGIIPSLLGTPFERITENYFTILGTYVIFANSIESVKKIIDSYKTGKTLENDRYYQSFKSKNMEQEAGIYLYSSISKSAGIYAEWVNEEGEKIIEENTDLLRKFYALGVQLSPTRKMFYTNAYLKYQPAQKQEIGSLWEVALDAPISNGPWVTINHLNQTKEIVVQDEDNDIYLISNTGKVLWKKKMDGPVIGQVHQIDLMKNKKFQLLFNTRSHLYLLDRNGKSVKGYPVELPVSATNGVSVVDVDNNREYGLLIACENKRIYCYKGNGELNKKWKFQETEQLVVDPVQVKKISGKYMFLVKDVGRNLYAIDRYGELKYTQMLPHSTCEVYLLPGKDLAHSKVMVSDSLGKIHMIAIKGEENEQLQFQEFKSTPYFSYADVTGDENQEYIMLDRNKLYVYGPDKRLMYSYEFKNGNELLLSVLPVAGGKAVISVIGVDESEIYLFNENGQLFPGFPVFGNTNVAVSKINNDDSQFMVTGGKEGKIYVYEIKN